MKRWFNKPASKAPVAPQATAQRTAMPMMLALEPRIMFDAAAAATVVDVTHHDATHDVTHDAAQAAAAAAPPAAAPSPAPEAAVAPAPTPAPAEAGSGGNTVVFVDARVRDASSLLQDVAAGAQVVQLQEGQDGLQQMADYLAAHPGASSVQVIAHGNDGDLWLGSTYLSGNTVADHAAQLAAIGSGIRQGGDILVYACDTAAGDQGRSFVNSLAALSGRDVAASDDRTGTSGDWDLEVSVGSIEAVPALALSAEAGYAHDLAIITVTSNADSGAGSLRNAITSATAGDTITFNAGMTVTLSSGQLTIGKNLTIDGDLDNNGTADVTIDANYTSRVMSISAGQTVSLDGLVLTHGLVAGNGGAGGSSAATALGGGISNAGTLTLNNVSVTSNAAAGGGGGGGVAFGLVGGGGGGGGGIGGGFGGTGGSTGSGTGTYAGVAGSANTGGRGGGYNAVNMGGRGGTSTGGAGGIGVAGYTNGGAGGTANNGSISIGGGGGGAGYNATGGVGSAAAGGIYNTGTVTIIGTSVISNNLGAGGGGGGGGASAYGYSGGAGGLGVGGIYNNGGLVQMTAANFAAMTGNAGGSGSGGTATGGGGNGATPTASNNITTLGGGTTNTNYNPNAAPTVGNLGGDSVSHTEGGSATLLDASSNATVADADSADFSGGNVTVSIVTNRVSGEDVLAIVNQGTGAGQIGVSGSNVTYGGTTIGTFAGGSGTNDLVVTLNSNATPTAVQALVRNLTYSNSNSTDPSTSTRTVRVTVNDGDGGTSSNADVSVSVVGVNDAPTLTATGGTPTYTENGSAVDLFSGVSISAVESGQTITGLTLTVTNLANGASEIFRVDGTDIALTNGTSGTTTGGNTITYSVSVTGSTATVTLTQAGGLSAATAQTLVDGMSYRNTSDTPNTTSRVVTLTSITDNGGTSNGGVDTTSTSVAATVAMTAVNDAPSITAPGSISITEDVATALTGISFSDADAASGSVTVIFSTASGSLAATSGGGVTVGGSGTGSLTMTGSIANINTFIAGSNVSFTTASNATANVTLTVAIDDGGNTGTDPGNSGTGSSEASSTTVTLANSAVNDAPVNSLPATQSMQADATLVFNSGNSNLVSISDVDVGSNPLQITLTAANGTLSLSGTTGLSFTVGSGTADATMTFTGSLTDIDNALNGMVFTPTAGYFGAASVQLATSDQGATGSGGTQTDTDTINITVNPNNPVVTSVSSSTADGSYGIGDTITVTMTFNAAVSVDTTGGTPTLLLETGSTDRTATYVSGSGTNTLSFSYTVQAGDLSADLDYNSTSALVLNGATIRDGSSLDAVLTLPTVGGADSIAGQRAIVVDGVLPTASVAVADAALAAGETSLVTITFSEAVTGFTNADLTVANGTLSAVSSSDGGVTWTATFTPTASITDTSNVITLDNTGVTDAAGNAGAGTTDSNNYAIDTTRPTASIVVADTALAAGETSLVTITLSEAVSGFTNADLTVANGTLSAVSSSDGGVTWTATFTPTASVTDTSNVITLDNTAVQDAAGNTGTGTTDSNNYAIDTARPTASIVVADAALAAGETSLVTIAFSEAVSGFTNADLTVANGTLSAVSSSDGGITWTATFTPTADITTPSNVIALDNTGVTDAAGNTGTGSTDSNHYAIDTTRPTASIVVADASLTAGETSLVTVTFSEAVTGFTNADLTVANGTLSAVSSSDGGVTWTATFTPTASVADTSNVITLDNTGVTDAAGNAGAGTTDSNNYAIDTQRPTASIVVADAALAAGETSLVTITFSEAVSGFTNADLTVANGTLSAVSSSDGGVTWTATLTPTASITDTSNVIALDHTGVLDAAGNTGTGTTDSNNYAIDTARPTATIVVADSALTAGETSTVTITFSEAVTGFTTADLTVANGSLSGLGSADGGVTWTATLTPTADISDTSNVITLDNAGVLDAAGNAGTGTTDSNNYAIDTARPSVSIVVADTSLAAGETSLVTITFSEAVSSFTNADLTVANGTLSAVSSADGGLTWTATFTPTADVSDTANVIALANTGVQDAAGNTGTGTTDSNNYAIDTQRPAASIVVADTSLTAGETPLVTITFNEAVTGLTTADFTVANGSLSGLSSADGGITWTAILTPTAGTADTTNLITLDNTGVQDAAGNAGTGTTDSNNYAIDTVRPTATIVVADTALAAGDTSLVTITFSEAVSSFTNADLTVVNGTLSAVTSSDGGLTWTATFTPTASVIDATNVITLTNTGVQDAAGNTGTGTTDSNNYAIDTARPAAAIVVADAALAAGETSLVTVTFSEAVTGITTADFTVANGALSGLASSDGGTTWTATLTPTANVNDATNLITLDNTGVQDAAGNAGTGATDSNNYVIDTTQPVVTSVTVPANGTYVAGQNLDFTVNLSEAVTVDTSGGTPRIAVTLDTGGTVFASYLGGSGTGALIFRLTVASGQLDSNGVSVASSIDLDGATLRDAAGNDAATTLDNVPSTAGVRVDGIVPAVATVAVPPGGLYNVGDVLSFIVNTSEAVTISTTGGTPRLALNVGGSIVFASYVSGSGTTALQFQYTVQAGDNGADGIAVSALQANGGTLRDAAGNDLALTLNGVASTTGVVIDTAAPVATGIVRVDATPTLAGPVHYTVTFSEAVSGLDASDFTLTTTGTVIGSIVSVTQVDAQTYTVLVGGLAGQGLLGLDLNASGTGIADAVGNAIAGGLEGQRYELRPIVVVPPVAPLPPAEPPAEPPIVVAPPAPPVTLTPLAPISPVTTPTLTPTGATSSQGLVVIAGNPFSPDALAAPTIAPPAAAPADGRSGFIEIGAASGAGLRAMPDIGDFNVQAGQPVNIALPASTFSHSERNVQVSVEVRLTDGRPLPSWLKFDPVSGTLSGQPPRGLNQKLSIEVIARDDKGNRATSHMDVEVRSAPAAREAPAPRTAPESRSLLIDPTGSQVDLAAALALLPEPLEPPREAPAGRAGLAAQFDLHGAAARQAERADLLEHARAAARSAG